MLNWERLKESEEARQSRSWFYASAAMIGAYLAADAILESGTWIGVAANALMAVFYVVWYLTSARRQIAFVEQSFGDDYPRRDWSAPLLAGLVAGLAVLCVAAVLNWSR
jgi:hypothetical protein